MESAPMCESKKGSTGNLLKSDMQEEMENASCFFYYLPTSETPMRPERWKRQRKQPGAGVGPGLLTGAITLAPA